MSELNNIELIKDLPQLIVALDSLDDAANYVHINDVKEDITYYCPCCKGIIKPRAYKNDREYQYQAHFYHENGGCNEESFVHYICKTWLFEKGCKFKILDTTYTVSNIKTEKILHTEFGDYKPDIIVDTDENKTFFFEIKYSNKKTEHYIPKWDELGNDVVEVDARYFINQKFINDVPIFKLIYSGGECFIKTYIKSEYDNTIAKRKLEWKRQDKLNYKIMWERLDWFWITVQNYKLNNNNLDSVMESFNALPNIDKELCFEIVKKISCIKSYNDNFRKIINDSLKNAFTTEYLQSILPDNIKVKYINFLEKKGIYISSTYKSPILTTDIDVNHSSKEWIFRYSEIVELINKITMRANHYNNREHRKNEMDKILNELMTHYKSITCNTIWDIKEEKYNNFYDFYNIDLEIKNSTSFWYKDSFRIYCEEFDNITRDNVSRVMTDNFTKSMTNILNYVNRYDGLDSTYRHMISKRKMED